MRPALGRVVKMLVWMQHMADRMGLTPDQRPTRGWMLRFAAASMASLGLWGLFIWVLVLLLGWTAPL